jgi:hypothetical protein
LQTDSPFNPAIATVTQGASFQFKEKRGKLKGSLDGPYGGLTQSTNGNLYGTTCAGGTVSGSTSHGRVNENMKYQHQNIDEVAAVASRRVQ